MEAVALGLPPGKAVHVSGLWDSERVVQAAVSLGKAVRWTHFQELRLEQRFVIHKRPGHKAVELRAHKGRA